MEAMRDMFGNNLLRTRWSDAHTDNFGVGIESHGTVEWIDIKREDAPGIALEILKAAGWRKGMKKTGYLYIGAAIDYLDSFVSWKDQEGKWLNRKNELTNQLINPQCPSQTRWLYCETTEVVQRAVDMIVELEKKAEIKHD